MAGAYTAKPEADDTPDVPDGWDVDWPFPGAFPPGYSPVYSIGITGGDYIDGPFDASVTLYDHVTYATREPAAYVIVWTASIGGDTVQLRFAGDPSYTGSVSSNYIAMGGDFWGATPSLEFETTEDDCGETLTLTATSTVWHETAVVGTKEIGISVGVIDGDSYGTYNSIFGLGWYGKVAVSEQFLELALLYRSSDGTEPHPTPPEGADFTVTATVNGSAVQVRSGTEDPWTDSCSFDMGELSAFTVESLAASKGESWEGACWGVNAWLFLNLSLGDGGDDVVVTVTASTGHVKVCSTRVCRDVISVSYSASWNTPTLKPGYTWAGSETIGFMAGSIINDMRTWYKSDAFPPSWYWDHITAYDSDWYTASRPTDNSILVTCSDLTEGETRSSNKLIGLKIYGSWVGAYTASVSWDVYKNGVLLDTHGGNLFVDYTTQNTDSNRIYFDRDTGLPI